MSAFSSPRSLLAGLIVSTFLIAAPPALAQSGGTTAPGSAPPAGTTGTSGSTGTTTVAGSKAKLTKGGAAIAPAGAPIAVQNAIAAGNRIRKMPYRWGGGHASFEDTGYDCSGAVSYVLNAAGLLPDPLASGPFMTWADPGPGSWITVYANRGHMYAVIAGLRWDTSAYGSGGKGPRWRATPRPAKGYTVRHTEGY